MAALEKMHDITGLDPISYWPLAIGWWLLIGLVGALLFGIIFFYLRHKKYRASYWYFMEQKLTALENSIATKSKKYIITELSEILRQVAMQKYPRAACASLTGIAWLEWLQQHDPKQFDWPKYGSALLLGPYAPDLQNVTGTELTELIQAVKKWGK